MTGRHLTDDLSASDLPRRTVQQRQNALQEALFDEHQSEWAEGDLGWL